MLKYALNFPIAFEDFVSIDFHTKNQSKNSMKFYKQVDKGICEET